MRASGDKIISSKVPELIKKRKRNFAGLMTTIHKNLGRLIMKTAGKFDHERIKGIQSVAAKATPI